MLMPGLLSEITVKICGTSLQDEQITAKSEHRNMKLTVNGTGIGKLPLCGGVGFLQQKPKKRSFRSTPGTPKPQNLFFNLCFK